MSETILAIDDEPRNLRLIERYLSDTDYALLTAKDGVEGWDMLQRHADAVDVILLDRMMPNMDGMAFMQKIKAEPELCRIPVIMQTAAAEASQVAEGVRSGVYYYLTKPFEEDVLLSIVSAALQAYNEQRGIRAEVKKHKRILGLMRHSEFCFQTLQDARDVTAYIANFFPDPDRMVLGLSELLINAVEHGNLGITYDEKTELNAAGIWQQEVERRLSLPQNAEKYVRVQYQKRNGDIVLTVADDGPGFDWRGYLELDTERITHNHGRGIAMSRLVSFDSVEYQGNGNTVVCTVALS
jgi:CheY-like chemotaxis protein/anti-sigma regulatory factor (Ser/Thr protein kinase)